MLSQKWVQFACCQFKKWQTINSVIPAKWNADCHDWRSGKTFSDMFNNSWQVICLRRTICPWCLQAYQWLHPMIWNTWLFQHFFFCYFTVCRNSFIFIHSLINSFIHCSFHPYLVHSFVHSWTRYKTAGWLVQEGLTSHQTHLRSYRGRVFTDQMTQPTVSSQLGCCLSEEKGAYKTTHVNSSSLPSATLYAWMSKSGFVGVCFLWY